MESKVYLMKNYANLFVFTNLDCVQIFVSLAYCLQSFGS